MNDFPANSEKPENRLARLLPAAETIPETEPATQSRQCAAITRKGERCKAWAVNGEDQCAGHLGLYRLDPERGSQAAREAAEKRREDRMNLRDLLAEKLETSRTEVVDALRDGLQATMPKKVGYGEDAEIVYVPDNRTRMKAAELWVTMIYGKQLTKPGDEANPEHDLAAMPREEREKLKRELLAEHPDLAARLRLAG